MHNRDCECALGTPRLCEGVQDSLLRIQRRHNNNNNKKKRRKRHTKNKRERERERDDLVLFCDHEDGDGWDDREE